MTQDDATASLVAWLQGNGHQADSAVVATWSPVFAGHESWIFTPPGMVNAVYIVLPTGVRMVRPSEEALGAVLAELGLT